MRLTYAFSSHGASRKRERSMTRKQIDAALNNAALTLPGNKPKTKKYIGHPETDGRQPVVVATDPPNEDGCVTIITCYFQSPS